MGKAAKAHRAKVLKRNRERQHIENKMKKEWNAAFEEQMEKMKEQFASMSGDTMSGLTGLLQDEENIQEETTQEGSESTEPVQGE